MKKIISGIMELNLPNKLTLLRVIGGALVVEAVEDLLAWFDRYGVTKIFAYNANFDRNHLPELRDYDWYDIMRLAAYRQHNPKIPAQTHASFV